ncbi:hypothetical protein QFZ28_000165 [Neobacillus niacini]|uniref:DUF2321 domain-containing protein n=1 Tax=Neobacillus niacini TaxID=86668 RepID=UPI0027843B68|nr:DUF2321 domain-containing protein [Neobacillus niacini]MDQ0999765.1 hypothetical protein [Neobacillus niacini]
MKNGEIWYDTAEICLNGHVSNEFSISYPESNKNFCDKCGEETITECPICDANIRGYLHIPGVGSLSKFKAPSYCDNCGNPYPWTAEKLNAAKELADLLDELSPEEQEQLKKSLDDLVKDGPRTVVAQTRFKRILSKTGPEIVTGFRDILVDVVSETVKKAIWGP